ncbi:MAG: aldehyde dehydrogenase [Elusimicrobia bacterium]|nr:aldehyde dehydrogenase [Elusimicrobiota bacterium]
MTDRLTGAPLLFIRRESKSRRGFSGPQTEEVRSAIERSRGAQPLWAAESLARRVDRLDALRRVVLLQSETLAHLMTREIGKPLIETLSTDFLATSEGLSVLARRGPDWLAPRREPRTWMDVLRGVKRFDLFREPLGVVGVLNSGPFSLAHDVLQLAAALLAGNTVIWKPSPGAPISASATEDLFRKAGFPPGVFEMIHGDGAAGETLCRAGVEKLFFTGSAAEGRVLMLAAAEAGTPVVLQSSGKDAALVFNGADLARAVRGLVWAAFSKAGQNRAAARRIIVEDGVFDLFSALFVEAVASLRIGAPEFPDTEIGPLPDEERVCLLEDLVGEAKKEGARVLLGGRRRSPGDLCFEPTVLADVSSAARIAREEYSGPVVLLSRAADEEEMVRLANDTPGGLAASVWLSDLSRARAVARKIQVGTVWINDGGYGADDVRAPFGGTKASGFGRVHGPEGLAELTRTLWVESSSARGGRPHYFPYGEKKWIRLRKWLKWRHP